jgi:hypothetical protein
MTQIEILEEIKKLSTSERLTFIEAAIRLIREDLQLRHELEQRSRPQAERRRELETAAKALLPDYIAGGELTAFTVLDSEDFHA